VVILSLPQISGSGPASPCGWRPPRRGSVAPNDGGYFPVEGFTTIAREVVECQLASVRMLAAPLALVARACPETAIVVSARHRTTGSR